MLDVARAGREKKGIGKIWRFHNNAGAAEAFSYVLQRAEKVRRVNSCVFGLWLLCLRAKRPRFHTAAVCHHPGSSELPPDVAPSSPTC